MFRVRTVFTGVQGAPWLSTMYFDELSGTAAQAVTAVGTFWRNLVDRMGTQVTWATEAEVSVINAATGEPVGLEITTPESGTGSDGTALLPIATQGLVRWRTGIFIGGREVRGRTFVPGLTEGQADLGRPTSALLTDINASAANLLSDANSTLLIYSRKNHSSSGVVTGSTWDQFAVLRSRRD